MTIYIVLGCIAGVVSIYLYGKREGKKTSELNMLAKSNEKLNELRDVKSNIEKDISKKLHSNSGDRAIDYWMSNGSKKS